MWLPHAETAKFWREEKEVLPVCFRVLPMLCISNLHEHRSLNSV